MGTRDRKDYSITRGYLYGNHRQEGLLYNKRISVREPETERITLLQEDICMGTRDRKDYSITRGYLYGN